MNTIRYTAPARLLHWLMAALLVPAGAGLYMSDLPLSPENCNCMPGINGRA